jgi:hypothetical protein
MIVCRTELFALIYGLERSRIASTLDFCLKFSSPFRVWFLSWKCGYVVEVKFIHTSSKKGVALHMSLFTPP